MASKATQERYIVRFPPGMRGWIAEQASMNASSMNSEIVRAVRERIDRIEASVTKRKTVTKQTA